MPLVILIVLLAASACAQKDQPDNPGPNGDNATLRELFEADQADRAAGDQIDWTVVSRNDSLRRVQVRLILDSNAAITSGDYYHAAMVFQHGSDTTAARLAYDLARHSVVIDSANSHAKWLMAAAWDRYRMRLGEPQWYGTQYVRDNDDDPWRLYDVDTTAVSDEERLELGVPTLEESRARVDEMNREHP